MAVARAFDYSKWDKLDLSDDEDDVHPNIDRESFIRMKKRSYQEKKVQTNAELAKMDKQEQSGMIGVRFSCSRTF